MNTSNAYIKAKHEYESRPDFYHDLYNEIYEDAFMYYLAEDGRPLTYKVENEFHDIVPEKHLTALVVYAPHCMRFISDQTEDIVNTFLDSIISFYEEHSEEDYGMDFYNDFKSIKLFNEAIDKKLNYIKLIYPQAVIK